MNIDHWPKENIDFNYIGTNPIVIQNKNDISLDFLIYSNNFLEAANILINNTLQTHSNKQKDSWFFSIVYLYRQSLELLLKSIAFRYIKELNQRKSFVREVGHNLIKAFEIVLGQVGRENISLHDDEFIWIRAFLKDISETDEKSDIFRYPFTMDMNKYFSKQTSVNLYAIGINMNYANTLLNNLMEVINDADVFDKFEPKLLIESSPYETRSVVGWIFNTKYDFYQYIEGYIESANYIFDIILNKKADSLFLPMCYLFRNGIELSLKRLLVEDVELNQKSIKKILKKHKHSVSGIWKNIRGFIAEHTNSEDDNKTLDYVDLYINKLHEFDGSSTKFRYPVDKSMNFHFKKTKKFDVVNIYNIFNELFMFLDSVDSQLSVILEWKSEMESYEY